MGEINNISKYSDLITFKNKKQELCLNLFRLIALIMLVVNILNFNMQSIALCILLVFVTYMPALIKKFFNISFNFAPVLICFLFTYGAVLLGTVMKFYGRFSWWDIFIHTLSGFVFMIIFTLLSIAVFHKLKVSVPIWVHFLIAFAMTATVGMFWEIYEFSVDTFFGMNTQHRETGVMDTMQDILCNTSGAMFGVILFYFSIAKNKLQPIRNMFLNFYKENNININ